MRRARSGAALALTFLTVLPLRSRAAPPPLSAAGPWFPVVGALVGALAGATRYAAEPLFGASVAAALALVVLVVVTGALHVDGLADCADGLGVRDDPARRLAVMRDPATGVFGVLALLGWGLLLTASLARLGDADALRALVAAAVVGRWAALVHAASASPARTDGLGASFAFGARSLPLPTAITIGGAVLAAGVVGGLAAIATGLVLAAATSAWARRGVGGRTGDTLGATVALTELAVCLTLLALAGA